MTNRGIEPLTPSEQALALLLPPRTLATANLPALDTMRHPEIQVCIQEDTR